MKFARFVIVMMTLLVLPGFASAPTDDLPFWKRLIAIVAPGPGYTARVMRVHEPAVREEAIATAPAAPPVVTTSTFTAAVSEIRVTGSRGHRTGRRHHEFDRKDGISEYSRARECRRTHERRDVREQTDVREHGGTYERGVAARATICGAEISDRQRDCKGDRRPMLRQRPKSRVRAPRCQQLRRRSKRSPPRAPWRRRRRHAPWRSLCRQCRNPRKPSVEPNGQDDTLPAEPASPPVYQVASVTPAGTAEPVKAARPGNAAPADDEFATEFQGDPDALPPVPRPAPLKGSCNGGRRIGPSSGRHPHRERPAVRSERHDRRPSHLAVRHTAHRRQSAHRENGRRHDQRPGSLRPGVSLDLSRGAAKAIGLQGTERSAFCSSAFGSTSSRWFFSLFLTCRPVRATARTSPRSQAARR